MVDFSHLGKIFANRGKDAERPQAGARFGISWGLMVALSLVLVCAVAWAFFMGYMVGKGKHPDSIGAIAGMKEDGKDEAPVFVDTSEPPVLEVKTDGQQQPAQPPKALAPPAGAAAQAWQAPQPVPARKTPARVTPASAKNLQKYNYVYQVAAIRNREEAEKMRAKLAGMKLKASLQKSGKVYLINVSLRGDLNDVAKMKDKLKLARLGQPLQVSRKPVEQPGRRQ